MRCYVRIQAVVVRHTTVFVAPSSSGDYFSCYVFFIFFFFFLTKPYFSFDNRRYLHPLRRRPLLRLPTSAARLGVILVIVSRYRRPAIAVRNHSHCRHNTATS